MISRMRSRMGGVKVLSKVKCQDVVVKNIWLFMPFFDALDIIFYYDAS